MSPSALAAWFSDERFWRQYLTMEPDPKDEEPFCSPSTRLVLPVTSRWSMELDLYTDLGGVTLSLLDGARRLQLGWDDLGHWHPHALRWHELEVFCRAIAHQDASMVHPGASLLLLYRFCPLADGDPVDAALDVIRSAFEQVGFPALAAEFLGITDFRGKGVRWVEEAGVECPVQTVDDAYDQNMLYSLRTPEALRAGTFPFRELAAAVTAANAALT